MDHQGFKIYLASRSPRRRELLSQIGISHDVLLMREKPGRPADIDESPRPGEKPADYVLRVCQEKASIAWRRLVERGLPTKPVLAADTAVCLGDRILGKPNGPGDAEAMLRMLSGGEHHVLTGVALCFDGALETALSDSVVRFDTLSDATIRDYVATGEPLDKAGGYGIQGHAAAFIMELHGSYSGVMGLPLFETARLVQRVRDKMRS